MLSHNLQLGRVLAASATIGCLLVYPQDGALCNVYNRGLEESAGQGLNTKIQFARWIPRSLGVHYSTQ